MKSQIAILSILLAGLFFFVAFIPVTRTGISDTGANRMEEKDTSRTNQWIIVDSLELAILPPSSGVRFYKDGIVFLSSTALENKMIDNHISFGRKDARYAELDDTRPGTMEIFSPDQAFPYPCEAITFSNDYKIMYYTRYSKREGVEKIFRAEYSIKGNNTGSWSFDEEPLDFCSEQYSYSHPTLSRDGKLMIFASNQSNSIGGMDLYASQFEEGAWSEPVNLGNAVNTSGNEFYPCLDRENNLYFSSDGIQGFGGYDIYVCKFMRNTWERPINLSSPINTPSDEVAFNVNNKDGRSAFYTIKEKGGKRSQYLNSVRMNNTIPDPFLTLSEYFTNPEISPMVILVLEPPVEATGVKDEAERLQKIESTSGPDVIEYRVHFMTSFNPRTRSVITIEDKEYRVIEYLYSGAYRLCIGKFSALKSAIELQNLLRKNEYPGATVVAFKNNILTLDPELVSEEAININKRKDEHPEIKETKDISVTDPVIKEMTMTDGEQNKEKPVQKVVEPATAIKESAQPEISQDDVKETEVQEDIIVYRVQILSTSNSKGSYNLTLAGKEYSTYEYFHVGAYRTCIGEFRMLKPAKELQGICRKNGYPQAFVIAFKNGKRSNDPEFFR